MKIKYANFITLILMFLLLGNVPAFSIIGPTLMLDKQEENSKEFTFGVGPVLRYKHNEASTFNFEGDMAMWGIRVFGGPMNDPEFGLIYTAGHQISDALRYDLSMTGLSMEDSFKSDPRFKWRITCGVGNYKLKSKASGYVYNKGNFGYLEPMLIGVLPLNRNIILEFGLGYTFAEASKIKVEGIAAQGELLLGKF